MTLATTSYARFCVMALICLVLATPAGAQGNASGPEVGVYQGQFRDGRAVFIAIDSFLNVGFASPQAINACAQNVGLFIAVGKGDFDALGSLVATVVGKCPDKVERSFPVSVLYDDVTQSCQFRKVCPKIYDLCPPTSGSRPDCRTGPSDFDQEAQIRVRDLTWSTAPHEHRSRGGER